MNDALNIQPLTQLPVPRLSFETFLAIGSDNITRLDMPAVIDIFSEHQKDEKLTTIKKLLNNKPVALFKKSRDPESKKRSDVSKILFSDYFKEDVFNQPDASDVFRIVSNIKHYPQVIDEILGMSSKSVFNYQSWLSSVNLWVSYGGQFGRSHFDEFENFNIQLQGRKRFVLLPPGMKNYYTRSLLKGFGHHSNIPNFDKTNLEKFPNMAGPLQKRYEIFLNPGQMLYLPLGWWHHVDSLDHINININFWLNNKKLFFRPYVLLDAVYKAIFRKLRGFYDYQPQ